MYMILESLKPAITLLIMLLREMAMIGRSVITGHMRSQSGLTSLKVNLVEIIRNKNHPRLKVTYNSSNDVRECLIQTAWQLSNLSGS
jgi:hypothetical protein